MSHEERTDLRIQRTHKFLQKAMIDLIAEKGFEAITVGDIAERAMINRATFYRHYEDKYDLVANIFEDTADQLVENMKPFHKDEHKTDTDKVEIWNKLFEHVAENAPLYSAMLGKNGSSWFATRMREHIIKIMLVGEKQYQQPVESGQNIEPAMPQELAVIQLSHALIGTFVWWLESEKRYTPRQMATWFRRFPFHAYLYARGYEDSAPGQVQSKSASVTRTEIS